VSAPPGPAARPEPPGRGPLRAARDRLVAQVLAGELAPADFPARYAAAADGHLAALLERATGGRTRGYALVAVGSYGRGELCPGSDLDLLLLHRGRPGHGRVAAALWYAIWDEGIRLDHSVRTRAEALALARSDLRAAIGLLDGRVVAGDADVARRLLAAVVPTWRRRARHFAAQLAEAAAQRQAAFGELAFLLEPDLKQATGGLRDLAALRALAAAFPELAPLAGDERIARAQRRLLAARVALQCRSGSPNDRLLLQEQDEVARLCAYPDADALMLAIAEAGRTVMTTCAQAWRRARSAARPRGAGEPAARALAPGLVLVDEEVSIAEGTPADDPSLLVRLARCAAEQGALVARRSLERLASECSPPAEPWPDALREDFVGLLSTGDRLVPVVEALDQWGLFERLVPEWAAVRNRPQRNAYHRFTVDRHLLEAVARATERTGSVRRPDLLLVGALVHDIGKGFAGDHTEAGTVVARRVAERMGFAEGEVATIERLVAYHLLLPELATRRDLDDPATARLAARLVEDEETLELLAALTEADGRATSTAAWGPWKADLVATLVERVRALLRGEERGEPVAPPLSAEQASMVAAGRLALAAHGHRVTVVAPDRTGLLAAVTGVLALHGCNVRRASAMAAPTGMAVEVFDVEPTFGRPPRWQAVEADLAAALDGSLGLEERLSARDRTYARARRPASAAGPRLQVLTDNACSERASIVEVRAPDRLGLLHRIARVLAEAGVDVASALVDTLGHEVVDTFYVRDARGGKLDDTRLAEVRALLEAAICAAG